MNRGKKMSNLAIFLLVVLLLGTVGQDILIPYASNGRGLDQVRMFDGLKYIDEGELDAVFLGASLAYNGVSPMKIYADTGIVSYILGSPTQPLKVSYFFLKDLLTRQHPRYAFLEAGQLSIDLTDIDLNPVWRYALDAMPMGKTKWEMAKCYAQYDFSDGFLSAIFPIIEYHTRWNELTKADFQPVKERFFYTGGQTIHSIVAGTTATLDYIGDAAENLKRLENTPEEKKEIMGEDVSVVGGGKATGPLYEYSISESNIEDLKQIIALCKEKGVTLVLFKTPTMMAYQNHVGAWTADKSAEVKELAGQLHIPYLDFMYEIDTGVDFTSDTVDYGIHLNIRGAEKLSACIGKWMQDNGLDGKAYSLYDEALAEYEQVMSYAYLASETDFLRYLERLAVLKENVTVCVAAYEEYVAGLTQQDYELLQKLGFQIVSEGQYMGSYAAVLCGGELAYEGISDRRLEATVSVQNKKISLTSAAWRVGKDASIKVNGAEYAMKTIGLNFVVIDNETGLVIDQVAFNTHAASHSCSRQKREFINTYANVLLYDE